MINEHIKKIVKDSELDENTVIRKFRITTEDGKVSNEIAKLHIETVFEKYRAIQDQLFMFVFNKFMCSSDSVETLQYAATLVFPFDASSSSLLFWLILITVFSQLCLETSYNWFIFSN